MTIAIGRGSAVVVRICMVVAMLHRLVAGRIPRHAKFALHAGAADWTQHGRSHCSAHREQHRKQQQEPDTDSFH